jgi:general secretion pathway protein G
MFHLFPNRTQSVEQVLSNQKGMSLIEILVALTLLALAGTFVAGKIFDQLAEGKISSAKIQIRNLSDRLAEYKRHCNRYPTTDQGLEALISKPTTGRECKKYRPSGYIEGGRLPLDPWDSEYDYSSPDEGRTFIITSYGADGIEGGEDEDADIKSNEI